MSSIKGITEVPAARQAPEPVLRGEFSYDATARSWVWSPLIRTEIGYDHPPPGRELPGPQELLADQAPVREAIDHSLRRGIPFGLSQSVIDSDGVAHEFVLCGLPDLRDGGTTVRGVVLEVTPASPSVSVQDVDAPRLAYRPAKLPADVTLDDAPWLRVGQAIPPHLLATLNLCLDSGAPTFLLWGEERRILYNQACSELIRDQHPALFGAAIQNAWPQAWAFGAADADRAFDTGEPVTAVDKLVQVRHGEEQRDYFVSYSLTPVRGPDGLVTGLFGAITDTTREVQRRRRLATLHETATQGVLDGSPEELMTRVAGVLARNPEDIPFVLMYLIEPSKRSGVLVASAGLIEAAGAAPERIRPEAGRGWPVAEAIAGSGTLLVDDLDTRFPGLLAGTGPESPTRALLAFADLENERLPNGLTILGVSTRQALDAEYQAFLNKVARHMHADLTTVATAQLDRERTVNLQRAMQSNRQIGAAIGILMTIHKVTEQQAFMLLSKASQQSNRKLRDIADDVILSGMLPPETVQPPARRHQTRRRSTDHRRNPED
jgi:hypothetical protein